MSKSALPRFAARRLPLLSLIAGIVLSAPLAPRLPAENSAGTSTGDVQIETDTSTFAEQLALFQDISLGRVYTSGTKSYTRLESSREEHQLHPNTSRVEHVEERFVFYADAHRFRIDLAGTEHRIKMEPDGSLTRFTREVEVAEANDGTAQTFSHQDLMAQPGSPTESIRANGGGDPDGVGYFALNDPRNRLWFPFLWPDGSEGPLHRFAPLEGAPGILARIVGEDGRAVVDAVSLDEQGRIAVREGVRESSGNVLMTYEYEYPDAEALLPSRVIVTRPENFGIPGIHDFTFDEWVLGDAATDKPEWIVDMSADPDNPFSIN